MTRDELSALGADIALAIRARGQELADVARRTGTGEGSKLIAGIFEQAAQVAELRTQLALIDHLTRADARPGS